MDQVQTLDCPDDRESRDSSMTKVDDITGLNLSSAREDDAVDKGSLEPLVAVMVIAESLRFDLLQDTKSVRTLRGSCILRLRCVIGVDVRTILYFVL